ncbi:MAG TPA: heme-binding protein, partial [Sphingobium sp.]
MAFTAALPLHSRQSFGTLLGRQSPRRIAGEIALGAAGLAIGGLALYFLKERTQEEAAHTVIERDGAFSLRRYERLVTAEVTRYGTIADAMDEGFRPLFDYIANKPNSRMPGATKRKI